MTSKSILNRFFIVLVAFVYVNFYFLSPFFHFHEELIRDFEKTVFHSHLFTVEAKNSNRIKCHQIVDQDDEHNHPIVINAVVTNLSPRFDNTVSNLDLFQEIIEFDTQIESNKICFVENFHFDKLLKDKCVHTASNVSPPAFVTV